MIKAFDEIFLTYKKVKAVIYHFQGQSLPKTAIFSGVRREMKIPVLKFRKKILTALLLMKSAIHTELLLSILLYSVDTFNFQIVNF